MFNSLILLLDLNRNMVLAGDVSAFATGYDHIGGRVILKAFIEMPNIDVQPIYESLDRATATTTAASTAQTHTIDTFQRFNLPLGLFGVSGLQRTRSSWIEWQTHWAMLSVEFHFNLYFFDHSLFYIGLLHLFKRQHTNSSHWITGMQNEQRKNAKQWLR